VVATKAAGDTWAALSAFAAATDYSPSIADSDDVIRGMLEDLGDYVG